MSKFEYNVIKCNIMKPKNLLEILTLSSSLYFLIKDTELIEKINEYSTRGKNELNKMMSEPTLDENGNELDFTDKVINKAHELNDELHEKIEELVVKFYKKINVAHLDEIKALNEKLEKSDAKIALLEARLNVLESK